jgi:dUTP pyrophosphatase
VNVNIKLLTPTARMPFYATPGAAGLDLYADKPAYIRPGETKLISTGILWDRARKAKAWIALR